MRPSGMLVFRMPMSQIRTPTLVMNEGSRAPEVGGLKRNAGLKTRHYKDKFDEGKEKTSFGRMALPGTVVGPLNFDPYCHDLENLN